MIYDGYTYREETPEEIERRKEQERIEAEQSQDPPAPTPEERLDKVEADVDALSIIITGKEVSHGNQ